MISLLSLLFSTRFQIVLALVAQANVDIVSSMHPSLGLMHAINRQQLFPPNDCFRSEVSFDYLQGMNDSLFYKLFITFRRENNDLLMSIDSRASLPSPIILSDPAKSTNYNLLQHPPIFISSGISNRIVNIVCDLDDERFSLVEATTRFLSPSDQIFIISSWSTQVFDSRFSTENQFSLSHLIFKPAFMPAEKSPTVALKGLVLTRLVLRRSYILSLQICRNVQLTLNFDIFLSLILSKSTLIPLGIIPSASPPIVFVFAPSIVYVLPAPVCPNANTVELQPQMTLSMTLVSLQFQKTSDWVELGDNTVLKRQLLLLRIVIYFGVKVSIFKGYDTGRMRTATSMFTRFDINIIRSTDDSFGIQITTINMGVYQFIGQNTSLELCFTVSVSYNLFQMFSSLLSQVNSAIKQAKATNNTLKKTLTDAKATMGIAAAQPPAEFNPMLQTAPAACFPKAQRFKQKPKQQLGFTNTIGLSESTYSTVESTKGVAFPKQQRWKDKKPVVETLLYPKVDIVKKSTQGVSIAPVPQRERGKLGKSTYSESTADGGSVASLGPGTYTPNTIVFSKNAVFSKDKRFKQQKTAYTDELPLYPKDTLTRKRPPTMAQIKTQTAPNAKLLLKQKQQQDRKRLKFLYWQAVPLEFDRLFKSSIGPIIKQDYFNVSKMTGSQRKCAMQMLIDRMNFLRGGFDYQVAGDMNDAACAAVYRKSTPKPFKWPLDRSPGPDEYYPKDDLVKPSIIGYKFAKYQDKLVVEDDKRDYDVNYDFFKKVHNVIINPEHQPKRLTEDELRALSRGPGFYDALFSQVERRDDIGITKFAKITESNDRANNLHEKKDVNDGVYFPKYTAIDKNIAAPLYKAPANVHPQHLPQKQLFPLHWQFYDGDLNKVRAQVAKNVLLAGGMSFQQYQKHAKQISEFKEYLNRQNKTPDVGEYEVTYTQIDPKVLVPDLDRMQQRGLIDPIVKQQGDVDGDNLILNPDKPRPKLPNIDFGKMVPRQSDQPETDEPRQGDALLLDPRLPQKKLPDIKFEKMIGRDDNQPEENEDGNDGERVILDIKYPDKHIPTVNIEKQVPREEPKDQMDQELPPEGDRLKLDPSYSLIDKKPKGFVDMKRHSSIRLVPILRKLKQQNMDQEEPVQQP